MQIKTCKSRRKLVFGDLGTFLFVVRTRVRTYVRGNFIAAGVVVGAMKGGVRKYNKYLPHHPYTALCAIHRSRTRAINFINRFAINGSCARMNIGLLLRYYWVIIRLFSGRKAEEKQILHISAKKIAQTFAQFKKKQYLCRQI